MTSVLIADDHTLMREALSTFIQGIIPDAEVEKASDGEAAYNKVKSKDFSIIVLDVNMPNTDSFDLVRKILAHNPQSKILMYSMNAEEIFATRFLKLGVKGYLRKDANQEELEKAIKAVLNNKRYVSHSLSDRFVDNAFGDRGVNPFKGLSRREFELVHYLVQGKSVAEIARVSGLTNSSVSIHKSRIFKKLGVKNEVELVRLAQEFDVEF